MLAKILTRDCIRLNVLCEDWKEAVKAGTDLLLGAGCIEPAYLAAIIRHHEELGPYMVVAPGIVLAHARPEEGAKKVGLSLVTLKDPIAFGNETNDPVKLVLTFSTVDQQVHLDLLSNLMELLSNEADIAQMMREDSIDMILAMVRTYSN